MPIYEYRCNMCGEEIEVIQKFSDSPLRKCKKCGGKLERLMSNSAFHLKGTGWYKTDYAAPKKDKEKGEQKGGEKKVKGDTHKKGPADKSTKAKEKAAA